MIDLKRNLKTICFIMSTKREKRKYPAKPDFSQSTCSCFVLNWSVLDHAEFQSCFSCSALHVDMCPVDKNQFSFILNQLFFEPARIQKGFLSQLKVQGIFAKKPQKGWDMGAALGLAAIAPSWLNKVFVSLKSCKERAESYFKHISFSISPPALWSRGKMG